jgi:hypothetical protein
VDIRFGQTELVKNTTSNSSLLKIFRLLFSS